MNICRFTGVKQPLQWRRRFRVSWIVMLIALGAVSSSVASASGSTGAGATRHSASDPVCCVPDDRGPKKFSALIVTGKVSDGAIVSMTVGSTNYVGLVVARHLRGNLVGLVGVVPLGRRRPGRHKVRWNLKVDGSPLAAGTYDVLLEVFDNQGHPSGLLPSRRYALLTVSSGGRDRVQMNTLP
jgi:hypothetical protein